MRFQNGCEMTCEFQMDWLSVKLTVQTELQKNRIPLAVQLWELMQIHFTTRIVLDISCDERLNDYALRQLIALSLHLRNIHGMIRVCGLSNGNRDLLRRYMIHFCGDGCELRNETLLGTDEGNVWYLCDDDLQFEEGQ